MKDFMYGAATSAYQIEGAWNEDEKLPSIWDEISHGAHRTKVRNEHTGDVACDHYHKWKEDVKLMKELGIDAYRFSISWSRIMPPSATEVNWKGMDFYKQLVYELKKNDIEPFVTLYHWDLPVWLDILGGWGNPRIINHFKGYACMMFEALSDVKNWITFNEPAVFVNNFWGHNDYSEAVRNVLLAHGEAVRAFRQTKTKGKIGISLNLIPAIPHGKKDIKKDKLAAENISKTHNGIWLDPIYKGRFPEDINKLIGFDSEKLVFSKEESKIVSTPIDFLGINYYTASIIEYDETRPPSYARGVPAIKEKDEMDTAIVPYGIYSITEEMMEKYGNPEMYITENGCAFTDSLTHDNEVHDHRRINYIKRHLEMCKKAVDEGINLKGYFYWSLMDNFEWAFGYTKRFGLVYIHYPTLERIPKDSFYWYQGLIRGEKMVIKNGRTEKD